VSRAVKPDSTASQQMIRFSLDVSNSSKEIEQTITAVQHCVRVLREE
jgi:cysteine sulfinate desulfinase/cysteine desulfurase-like protein